MQTTVKMSEGGVVVIPETVREAAGLNPGDFIIIDVMKYVVQTPLESILDPDVAAIESMSPEERAALEDARIYMKKRLEEARKKAGKK